ncbi:hypothetical protein CFC21_016291 [Triticum aestivum]|uniref:Uncharacterized protein n=3 Tax=Triticum TaxID=4564 RepID=A0A9R1AYT8_TRITD|nr:uncharacterized protein LOC123127225 isoform X4 [Triticum aestivum]KAF7000369.1 hypothetical protein CFC21_016291 [Triticum aestivum]VAI45206.1 unnamed protein product [Triticum turgidum subsp. durum]
MATVHARLGCLPPPPPPRLPRRRATFSAGPRRSAAARSRVTSLRRASRLGPWTAQALSGAEPSAGVDDASEIIDAVEVEPSSNAGASLLAKVAVALGVAATVTAISIFMKQPSSGPSFSLPQIIDASAQSDTVGYTFSQFGKKVIIPEYTPGWVYFWLLMAAGFGLFVSEEALNVWLGISKDKALTVSRAIQKYGNLIGFVERFSIGVRNPTGFLAGAVGVSADCYFAGVCCGCLFTLPIQLAIGFLLRERPVVALASVAAAVGIWTVFPYAAAACTALFLYLRRRRPSS